MTFARRADLAEKIVAATQARLPPELRALARAVPVCCEPVPDAALLADGIEPDLLGLFVGTAYIDARSGAQGFPPQIFLFLDNLRDYADGDPAAFREEVRLTYLHELGHYLGWNEDDLAARGLD
jgi:predicted Zn-dependent protease with MMP-like domain